MNKKPSEIFAKELLSTRFHLYQRDSSKKGQSLYISQLLQHIKRDFPDFKEHLDQTITKIRAYGSMTEADLEKAVLKAMRSHATTVEEIAEDCEISNVDARATLKRLQAAGKVEPEQHPCSSDYRDQIWFEIKDHQKD